MKKKLFIIFIFSLCISFTIANEYYVSTLGNSTNNGSIDNPWNLQYALKGANGNITAGDTIFLRNGTYQGPFKSNLYGNSSSPITVTSYPQEHVIIDDSFETTIIQDVLANGTTSVCRFNVTYDYPLGYNMLIGDNNFYLLQRLSVYTSNSSDDNAYNCFTSNAYKPHHNYTSGTRAIITGSLIDHVGNYTHFKDFEMTSIRESRFNFKGEKGSGLNLGAEGTGNKAINLIIHDVGHPAIGFWGQENQGEVYGCVLWGNGIYDMYENTYPSGYSLVEDNITASIGIYNVSIYPFTHNQMKIIWDTDVPSTNQIFLGTYHNSTENINFSSNNTLNSTLAIHHESIITLDSSSQWYKAVSSNTSDSTEVIGSFRAPWIRGNGIYSQNVNGNVTISDVITFDHFTIGAKCHGEGGYCNGFTFEGNVAFDNPLSGLGITTAIQPADNLYLLSNHVYNSDIGAGYVAEDNEHITIFDNYIADDSLNDGGPLGIKEFLYANVTHNIIYNYGNFSNTTTGGILSFHMPDTFSYSNAFFDYNRYYGGRWFADQNDPRVLTKAGWLISAYNAPGWINFSTYNDWEIHSTYNQTATPPDKVVIRKNKYEEGRSHVIIWNWENKTKINISLFDAGLDFADTYKIWDAQNYHKTILEGIYLGGHIQIPLNLTEKRESIEISHFNTTTHTPSVFNIFIIEKTSSRKTWYVSVDGNNESSGNISSPWSLDYALHGANGNITPGDIIYLKNGTYHGLNSSSYNSTFTISLVGNSSSKIYIKNYNNSRVTIDANLRFGSSSNLTLIGLEIMDSLKMSRGDPWDLISGGSRDITLINNIIHDGGICLANSGVQEAYGNILYYCGKSGLDHGIYWQNNLSLTNRYEYIKDNIIANSYGVGIHLYGQAGSLDGFEITGNVIWDSGSLSNFADARNILVGGSQPIDHMFIRENMIYYSSQNIGEGVQLGYSTNENINASLTDNYISARNPVDINKNFRNLFVLNNTLVGTYRFAYDFEGNNFSEIFPYGPYIFDNNTIYTPNNSGYGPFYMHLSNTNYNITQWQSISGFENNSELKTNLPSENVIFVRQNEYDPSRANIVIYNWENLSSVQVDVSHILQDKDHYNLHNAQDYFSDIDSGKFYQGDLLNISMINRTVANPISFDAPTSSFPMFGVFILIKTDHLLQEEILISDSVEEESLGGGGKSGGGGGILATLNSTHNKTANNENGPETDTKNNNDTSTQFNQKENIINPDRNFKMNAKTIFVIVLISIPVVIVIALLIILIKLSKISF